VVKGSTRTPEALAAMKAAGIEPYYISLEPGLSGGEGVEKFFQSEILVINFPPERREDIVDFHTEQIKSLISQVENSPVKNVIFVSSTSVYPELGREVFEDEEAPPEKASGKALVIAERLLLNNPAFRTTVLRFGGLIGYDRKPGRFISGKRGLTGGDSPVNLIHRDDCILIIEKIIEKSVYGEIFNACSDLHPKRKDYYTAQALKIGAVPPAFEDGGESGFKIVRSGKLKTLLGYEFKYPDPSFIG
ncbi:MAG: SDR family NAD(P)-dependent oxidoreductase, partial [Candidatus Dadabacteria bacterium]|nr:SDR family NAD(P)-dependent oxidoreductase [Candidatus Dadabacteria bacterium]